MQIEIYPNKMMTQFLEKGYADLEKEDAVVIMSTSYPERFHRLEGNRLQILYYRNTDNLEQPYAFTEEMAAQIAEKILNGLEEKEIKTIYVCCDDGQACSASIAAALFRYYGMDEMLIWNSPHMFPHPNIYLLMCRALGVECSIEDAKQLKEVNDRALQKAIADGTEISRHLYRYGLNSKASWEKRMAYFETLRHYDGEIDETELMRKGKLESEDEERKILAEVTWNSLEVQWYFNLQDKR